MAAGSTHAAQAMAAALALLALGLGAGGVAAQTRGDILPGRTNERLAPPRAAAPPGLRPTLEDREQSDPDESRLRPVARDGDFSAAEEQAPRDGIVELGESAEPPGPEGIDTAAQDGRAPSDFGAFESPPAGHDPLLFRIEDVQPLADRRVGAFFRAEPYQAAGLRIASFVLFPQAELAGVAFSNVLRSPRARSDLAFEFAPELRLASNWRWHALEFRARGSFSLHEDFDSENDRNGLIEARGRIDLSRRSNVQGLVSREVRQESRTGIDANRLGDRADVTTDQAAASFNHRWNRLAVQMRAGVTETRFGAGEDEGGLLRTRRDRNLIETEEAVRLRHDRRSGIGLFAEAAFNQRSFAATPNDGIARDSDGERYRFGLAFLPTHPYLRGEMSLGFGRQIPEARALTTIDGLLLDANVVWRMTPLTALAFDARTDLAESVADGVSGVVARAFGLELRQVLRRYLTATARLATTGYDYSGVALSERETTARLGLEYALSRQVLLFSRFDHIWFETSTPAGDWQADEVRVGVRIRP